MAVDSVNNNRTAVVAGSLAVGAAAGAGLGYANAKILEGDAPKDSFIRTLDSNKVAQEKKAFTEKQSAFKKIAESGSLENVSDNVKAEIKKAGGKGFDLEKAKPEKIKELAAKLALDEEAKKAKLKTLEEGSLSSLQKRAESLKKIEIPEKATEEDLKKIFRNNHELFGIKKTEKGTLDEAVQAFMKDKKLAELEKTIKDTVAKEKKSLASKITTRRNSITRLFESAYDVAGKKMKEMPKNATEEFKAGFKTVKNAIRNFKLTAAAKWGAIAGAALGVTSYVTAKLTGKAADKAIAEAKEECECPECEDCEEA